MAKIRSYTAKPVVTGKDKIFIIPETEVSGVGGYTNTVEEIVKTITEDFKYIIGKNLYNKNNDENNVFINFSDGTIQSNANSSVSEFIEVEPNTEYYISGRNSVYGISGLSFYDINKNIITTPPIGSDWSNINTYNGIYTTTSNVRYIRFTTKFSGSGTNDTIQFEKGNLATNYEDYNKEVYSIYGINLQDKTAREVLLETIKDEDLLTTIGKNKFDKTTMILSDKLVDNTGNLITVVGAKASRTPVKPNTEYAFTLPQYNAGVGGVIRFLNNTGNLISFIETDILPTSDSGIGKKLTTPLDTAFIENNIYYSVTNFSDITNTFQLEEGASVTGYESYSNYILKIKGFDIKDKNDTINIISTNEDIKILGDSITWFTGIYDYIIGLLNYFNFNSYSRLALSGATWTNTSTTVLDYGDTEGMSTPNNTIWNQINRLKKEVDDNLKPIPTIVFINAGTNDLNRPIGDVNTTFTGTILDRAPNTILTLSDAIRFNVELLLSYYPNTKIILSTPMQRASADVTAIGNMIESCAKKLSVTFVRQDYELGIYNFNEVGNVHTFLYDGLHQNELGKEKMTKFWIAKLKSIFNW